MAHIRPFEIDVPDQLLADLKAKLKLARFPEQLKDVEWQDGTPADEVKRLVKYWINTYDWKNSEKEINKEFKGQQFLLKVDIEGHGPLDIHFVHRKSSRPNAIPLLFSHGWPGHFLEVRKIIGALTEPEDPNAQAFHVVAPSLPGYGFSEQPKSTGFGLRKITTAFKSLMNTLGYTQYVIQGGDWGSFVARVSAIIFPETVVAIHVNMVLAVPPTISSPIRFLKLLFAGVFPAWVYQQSEIEALKRTAWFGEGEMGYFHIQSTKPQTISYGLTDSPVALLAWIREKLHTWTDAYPWTDAEIIEWIMIYWIAGPAGSVRLYKESLTERQTFVGKHWISQPFGVSVFPKELFSCPRDWACLVGNLKFWKTHQVGGHFAATEQPEILVEDLREFFGKSGGARQAIEPLRAKQYH